MWHTKNRVFIGEMVIFKGPPKTCGFTIGFEIFKILILMSKFRDVPGVYQKKFKFSQNINNF